MFIRLLLFAPLLLPAFAQESRLISTVRGNVTAGEPLAGNHLTVYLNDVLSRKLAGRCYVGENGSFEFRDVSKGTYSVELMTASGDVVRQQTITLNSSADTIDIRLAERKDKAGPAGKVSVRQLLHPLSVEAKRGFAESQKASVAGDYQKEIGILRGMLADPSAVPYARMNLGVAYLRSGQNAEAVPELQEAVRLMPEDVTARTNFAYALFLSHRVDEAEAEGKRGIELDRYNARARWVMGSILLAKGAELEEAVEHLHLASREIPKARVVLAQFYEKHGQKDEAASELRAFLPTASGEEKATVEKWLSNLTGK